MKYRDSGSHYPLSRLIWIDWKNEASIPDLSHQPKGGVCRKKSISRTDYERENESVTDFAYSVALARRGYSHDEIYGARVKTVLVYPLVKNAARRLGDGK